MPGNGVVEWRIFFPYTNNTIINPSSPSLLASFPFFAHEDPTRLFYTTTTTTNDDTGTLTHVEERIDNYLPLPSPAIGLKHRGKKGKLEVKIRTESLSPSPSGGKIEGIERWVKYKLGKHLAKGGKHTHDDNPAAEREMHEIQLIELQDILRGHLLYDSAAHTALLKGETDEIEVKKGRIVATYKKYVAMEYLDPTVTCTSGGGGGGGGEANSLTSKILQGIGLGGGGGGGGGGSSSKRVVPVEVLVEDCILDVASVPNHHGEGGGGGGDGEEKKKKDKDKKKKHKKGGKEEPPQKWRSLCVEGPEKEVQAFLAGTALGQFMYGLRQKESVIFEGYPGFILKWQGQGEEGYKEEEETEEEEEGGKEKKKGAPPLATTTTGGDDDDDPVEVHVCPVAAAAIEKLTASTIFPIPALPPNPYRGIKEACKIKQISLCVVQHPDTGKFLAVEEAKNKGWWLPAGHVDPGEDFPMAAYREALEEAGIGIQVTGLLRVEHKLTAPSKGRLRVVYYGRPIHPDAPLKTQPDEESISARWVTIDELRKLRLRAPELLKWAEYIEKGGTIYPLHLFAGEGEPIPSL